MNIFKRKEKQSSGGVEYIIVGLGNPGKQYEYTRHNVGFMAIDYIAEKCNTDVNKLKFKSLCTTTKINDTSVLLMKPSTFMNLSGQAVIEAMRFYKVEIEKVIVLFDDISLQPGKLRIRKKGSSGGHNGLKNIIYLSGKDNFPRIKIGVGQKPNPEWDLADWVLSRFSNSEIDSIRIAIDKTYEALKLIVQGNFDSAMNKFNS